MRIRYGWVITGVVLVSLAAVVWWLPARWVMPLLQPHLRGVQLDLVQGQLWNGRAGQLLTADGRPLGSLHWRLSHRLLLGELRLRVDIKGPAWCFGGDLRQLGGSRQEWRNVHLRLDLDRASASVPTALGTPLGTLDVHVPYALLQGDWPLQMQGWAQWRGAALLRAGQRLRLGNLRVLAQGDEGLIKLQMHDGGSGPLKLDGNADLSPLGWHLDASMQARNGDAALRRWLATLGTPQPDGTVHLQRSGGLAGVLPADGAKP